jgi:hypothetical protein
MTRRRIGAQKFWSEVMRYHRRTDELLSVTPDTRQQVARPHQGRQLTPECVTSWLNSRSGNNVLFLASLEVWFMYSLCWLSPLGGLNYTLFYAQMKFVRFNPCDSSVRLTWLFHKIPPFAFERWYVAHAWYTVPGQHDCLLGRGGECRR